MTVLSDGTVRQEMKAGRLVKNGEPARAVHCTYEFVPGKIYPGGISDDNEFVYDWTSDSAADRRFLVQPGAMVWIRVREQVSLPNDVCGLWLQTNTLSRKGLLLINASLVEPGYEGPLSCHFVNFGKSAVEIYPHTALAKLLFLKLDVDAVEPFKKVLDRYDEMIASLAAQSAKSFLQVSEMSARLEEARKSAEVELKNIADLEYQKLKSQLENDSRQRRMDESEAIRKDIEGYVKKALGFTATGVLLIGAISFGMQWLGSKFSSSDDALEQRIEHAIAKHVTIAIAAVPTTPSAVSSAPAPLTVPAVSWSPSPSISAPPPGTAPQDAGIQTQP